jgi:hypothetical protein
VTKRALQSIPPRHAKAIVAASLLVVFGSVASVTAGLVSHGPHTVPSTAPTTVLAAPGGTPATTVPPVALRDTHGPVAVTDGSFTVAHGTVTLTLPITKGATVFTVAAWFGAMGGPAALTEMYRALPVYEALVKPGMKLNIEVPAVDIPAYSPVYTADTAK